MSRTTFGSGNVVTSQADILGGPLTAYRNPGTVPGVIMCHGSGQIAANIADFALVGQYPQFEALRQRYCVGVGDFEFNGWGSNACTADIEAMRVWMQSSNPGRPQAKSGKIALLGASMGATVALNYALAHPDKVSCIALFIPAVGPMSSSSLSPSFQLAVKSGSSYSESVDGPTHNPQNATYQANFPNVPVHLWYSTGDTVATPDQVVAFAAGVPSATATVCSTTLDHGQPAIAAAPLADVLAFVAAHLS